MQDSRNVQAVKELYDLARRSNHQEVRARLHEDVTWEPAREGAWRPCTNADEVVRTLLWRAGMNKMRPSDFIDLGDRVLVQLKGRAISRLGAKGVLAPKLFQVIVFRNGKVAKLQDYPRREDALAS